MPLGDLGPGNSKLFGLQRAKEKAIADTWPPLNERDDRVVLAINNSFNTFLGYPHHCETFAITNNHY